MHTKMPNIHFSAVISLSFHRQLPILILNRYYNIINQEFQYKKLS